MNLVRFLFLFQLFSLECAATDQASEPRSTEPLWEFGLLGGLVQAPDYPTSDQSQARGLIFPNIRFRGKIFRSDQNEGNRVRLNQNPAFRFDFSFSGSFPAESAGNEARRGMPDLDATIAIGPRLKIRLLEGSPSWGKLELVLPVRFVYATNLQYIEDRGFTFSPALQISKLDVFCENCNLFLRLSGTLATERFNDFFHQVDPAYATPARPAYDAKGGLNRLNIFGGYTLRLSKVQAFLGMRLADHGENINRDGPLYRTRWNTAIILGVGWLFWESKERGYL